MGITIEGGNVTIEGGSLSVLSTLKSGTVYDDTYGFTDFSEFSVAAGVPTGLSYIGNATAFSSRGIANDAMEGNYWYISPNTNADYAITVDNFDSVLTSNQNDDLEMLGRVWVPTNLDNRRVGGPGGFIGGTDETDIDGYAGTLYMRNSTDYEIEIIQVLNGVGGVFAAADISEQNNVWMWIRFKVIDQGATDDLYIKGWYGDYGDEPGSWDATVTSATKRNVNLGLKIGWFLPRIPRSVEQRCSYLSFSKDPSTTPPPPP